ncbi:MAG: bifunctional diguanylate cyclase/phosphodiesterase [Halopseudomonas sp.]
MFGLLFGLFLIGVVALVLVALQLNTSSREQTIFYVNKAVEARSEALIRVVSDYAFWGEAYEHMSGPVDLDWAYTRNNLGATMYDSFEFEGVFVVNANNISTYAVINGELAQDVSLASWLDLDLGDLLAEARTLADDEAVAFAIARSQGQPVLISVAAFTSGGDPYVKELPGPAPVLVLVDQLGPLKMAALGENYGISQLRIATDSADALRTPTLTIGSITDSRVILRWDPPQPGNTMLIWLVPILLLCLLTFIYITRYNLRATLAAAHKADDSHNEARHYQTELVFQATHDSLTGLPNRSVLEERLKHACVAAQQSGTQVAVMMIDLDGFKPINDNFSHHLGDQVLVEVARRMLELVRPGDTVVRMGGDEFIVILPGVLDVQAVSTIAGRILQDIASPYQIDSVNLRVTASVGIVMSNGLAEQPLQLIQHADSAMYQAKQEGRNNAFWYTAGLSQQTHEMASLRNDLQCCIDNQTFELHYQPQVNSITGAIVGAEALLRWTHPVRGAVSPAAFIPLAETTGQIIPITLWVLDTACHQLRQLTDEGILLPYIAVNISSTHLLRASFVSTIQAALDKYGLQAAQLELEITETVLLNHADRALHTLQQLKKMGVRLAIDDFGVGFSSMNYLKVLPINKIKIDRSFISGTDQNEQDAAICQGIISMAHHLRLRVVAEGVEREGQRVFLRENHCDDMQGYLFAKAMSFSKLRQFIRKVNVDTLQTSAVYP